MQATRTDLIRRAIDAKLEEQRPCLDAGAPLTSVSVFVQFHPDGNVRRIQFRADDVRDRDRPVLLDEKHRGAW